MASWRSSMRGSFDAAGRKATQALGVAVGLGRQEVDDTSDVAESPGWFPALTLNAGIGITVTALAANASRLGSDSAVAWFYVGLAILFTPAAARATFPTTSRQERVCLVLMLAAALFAVRLVRAPVAFIDHDEFLHWTTANNILEQGRLFTRNALLPVSSLYPGLELVTTALVKLSGLSVFVAGTLILFVARLAFVAALYLFFERISASSRIGATATVIFMGSSTFVFFDAHFSYESLAVTFLAAALLIEVASRGDGHHHKLRSFVLLLPVIAALAVTHHVTAYFAAALLGGSAVVELFKRHSTEARIRIVAGAACALAMPFAWSRLMGNPGADYLGPVIETGLRDIARLATSNSSRRFFVADDGSLAPAWQRYVTVLSVGLICLGLATGFLRSLVLAGVRFPEGRRPSLRGLFAWRNSWLVVLTLLTCAYPVSILFRLTRSGWEVGNRLGPFAFYGVAIVLAIAIVHLWQCRSRSRGRAAAVGAAATVLLIGGVISSEGPRILVPSTFKVSADSASIEYLGISAARWTREWLGRDNVFATDRINRLLLSTYGRQEVATTLQDWRDTSSALLAARLNAPDRKVLKDVGVDYVMIDLRLTTGLPAVGVYFDGGEGDRGHVEPPRSSSLLKFNLEPTVGRVFDNGYQVIFDVRALDERP